MLPATHCAACARRARMHCLNSVAFAVHDAQWPSSPPSHSTACVNASLSSPPSHTTACLNASLASSTSPRRRTMVAPAGHVLAWLLLAAPGAAADFAPGMRSVSARGAGRCVGATVGTAPRGLGMTVTTVLVAAVGRLARACGFATAGATRSSGWSFCIPTISCDQRSRASGHVSSGA
eukprot:4704565-Prymnesium_polylepis.1